MTNSRERHRGCGKQLKTRRTAAVRGKSRSLANLTAIRRASSISAPGFCAVQKIAIFHNSGFIWGIPGLSGARGVVAGWGSLIRVGGDCMQRSSQISRHPSMRWTSAPLPIPQSWPPSSFLQGAGWCLPRWRWVPLPAPPVRLPFRCSFSSTVTFTARQSRPIFNHLGSIWHHQRFSGCPLHHGIGARHAENSAGRVCGD